MIMYCDTCKVKSEGENTMDSSVKGVHIKGIWKQKEHHTKTNKDSTDRKKGSIFELLEN